MPKAYSYLRFSTPEQMKGDSFRRQTTLAHEYAARNHLDLDDKLTFHDLGVSGFRGKNSETGRLAEFLEAVRTEFVPRGSYLLVESLDRISRQAARKAMKVLESICDEGITVVTLNDGRAYTEDILNNDPMALIMSLLVFIRANEESANKSIRLKAMWTGKRAKATQKPLTSNGPAWLRLNKDTGQWHVLAECADVVRRIFQEYLSGRGQGAITTSLNQERVPLFFRDTRKGKRVGAHWHRSYVRRLLENPAVIGAYIPQSTEYKDKKKLRKTAGQPVPGYFPAIIDEDTFQRAQALRMDTPSPLRGKNAHGETRNIFGGLAKCSRCGATMVYVSKGNYKGKPYTYLVCQKARVGAGCPYTLVPYSPVEEAFLRDAPVLLDSAPTNAEDSALLTEIERMDAALLGSSDHLEALADAYARTRLDALLKEMQAITTERDELQKRRDELSRKAGAVACPMATKRLLELDEALKAESLDRRKVNTLMRMVFERFTVDPDNCGAYLNWKTGGASQWVFFGFPKDKAETGVTNTEENPKAAKAA
ncbi:recombinase family protein [Corallococcus exercitus]|uniref:Recombinase family protein n=1 Tax=Corallococcus exercitus TaxID=2316736 RepID=A0A7Y4NU55_9BACT|nr:recombinase family protein [Corallococcus exercitus]NOK36531.1 recombinase family protein [Corallococcus exercitus]